MMGNDSVEPYVSTLLQGDNQSDTERGSHSVTEVESKVGHMALETIFQVLTHILADCFRRIHLFTT